MIYDMKNTIQITIKLFSTYQTDRFKHKSCEYPAETSVQTVMDDLQLSGTGSALINGRFADKDKTLTDGDTLALFPLVAGG
jgi:molybdopterin synthase sulfur carrier subunit